MLSWDSDELTRIHNLHIREFKDVAVSCGSLAGIAWVAGVSRSMFGPSSYPTSRPPQRLATLLPTSVQLKSVHAEQHQQQHDGGLYRKPQCFLFLAGGAWARQRR